MTCLKQITLKQGATLANSFSIQDGSTPITGIANQLKAQVRDSAGALLSTLVIAETATAGTYTMVSPDSTENWPLAGAYLDFKYTTTDGIIISSETLFIRMVREVTQ
ncbi:hypothetical protein AB840_03740 [Megasphaera cerevisiae DSM 20462]|uniref:BppU N-terminal domain-containing protein n=1 Tax=Megasphaera cerevisiae DSM 20462 TaxID=1122219 RepID=A0A0J6WZ56_9FIRM|nr:hypothetical protein [Megasphaera cerevisiae]KMO87157.1 hypothetical protein AB840_03740 [Megasphaera cerevisiae DSM 20462]SJZ59209.1 hypothetical protein SAMN05660900_00876 [Megasphaera cerevisiae DSM 20462]